MRPVCKSFVFRWSFRLFGTVSLLLLSNQWALAGNYILADVNNPLMESRADVSTAAIEITTPLGRFHGKRFAAADTKGYLGYRDPNNGRLVRWPLMTGRRLMVQSTGEPWRVSRWQVMSIAPVAGGPLLALRPTIIVNQPVEDVRLISPPALEPVEVEFRNSHQHEIVIQLVPRGSGDARPIEFAIPPGGSVRKVIQRDSGAVRQRVLVGVHGAVQVLEERVIPPVSLYDVVVHERKVTSVYFDRTKRGRELYGNKPVSANKSLVSIGVFQLPAGPQLQQGSMIEAYRHARSNRNPGLIRHYPYPRLR